MPDEPYTVTARRDRTSLVYYRQHDGSWKAPMFTRRLSLDELEQDFGPTVPVDVDNVEALLATLAEIREQVDTLAPVGRLYLDAVDADPDLEMVTLGQAYRLTAVREVVEAWESNHA